MSSSKQRRTREYKKAGKKDGISFKSQVPLVTLVFVFLLPLLFNPLGEDMFDGIKLAFVFLFLPLIFLERIFIERTESLKLGREGLLLLAAALWASLSSVFSVLPREAFFGEYLRRTGAILFLLGALIYLVLDSRIEKKLLRQAGVVSASLVSTAGIFQKVGLIKLGSAFEGRIFSTLGNPVFLGSFLLMTIPLSVELIRDNRWLGWTTTLLLICGIALSGSRAALLGAVILALIIAFLSDRKGRIFILISILVAGFVFGIFYSSRLAKLFSDISERARLAKPALIGIYEKPLFGYGFNQYESYFRQSPYTNWSFIPGKSEVPDTSHSFFVDAAFSSGIPFFVLFALFFGSIFLEKNAWSKKLTGTAVLTAFALSPASMPVILWSFLILSLASEPRGIEIRISGWLKKMLALILALTLILGLISGYRILVSDFYYGRALKEAEVRNLDTSLKFLRNAISLQPYEETYWRNYITTLLNRGGREWIEKAEVEALKLVEIDPYDFANQYLLGSVYLALGDSGNSAAYEKALNVFKVCIYLSPRDPQVYYQAGLSSAGMKNIEEAIFYWKKAVNIWDEYTDAFYALGYAYESQGKKKEAAEFYRKALKVADDTEKPAIENALKRLKKKT